MAGLHLVSRIYDLSGIPDSFLKGEARMTPDEAAAWSPITSSHRKGPHRILVVGAEGTRPFHDDGWRLHNLLKVQARMWTCA